MNLLPSPDQQEIVDAAAGFLANELPATADRAVLWARMGGLGWFALGLPETAGGAAYGLVEEALLFRELGRALAPGPFLAQVLGAHAAAAAGDEALAAGLAAGDQLAGLAEPVPEDGRHRLLDAEGADVLTVVGAEGVSVVDAGVARDREVQLGLDPTVTVETARLEPPPAGGAGLLERGRVLVAAMLAGICEATRDESAAYARVREQFGKPIGAFQAVKHRCADMAVRAEAAGALTFLAALSLQEGTPDGPDLVRRAKALASEHAVANAADDIQNHGGTGFTAGCRAHLYLKRANLLSTVLGTPAALFAEAGRC